MNNFLALKNDTEKSVYRLFSYPLLKGLPQILSYNEIKEENQQEKIAAIIETKKATKKDLEKWPNYLKKLKEEFKIIKKGGEQ